MFNALSRNTRQSFMVLAAAVAIVAAAGTVARGATVLHGPAARKAVDRALLPYIMQYRLIKSIQFTAEIRQSFANYTAPLAMFPRRAELMGVYKFWADGNRYRINWRVTKSNYQAITQQLITFDGRRYEAILGAHALIGIWRHRMAGYMGPGASNPTLSPIKDICWRATARRPGDWLNWRRVTQFPYAVDKLPKSIVVGYCRTAGDGITFSYNFAGARWPKRWSRKSAPPRSFRPGRPIWSVITLQKRGKTWLPVSRWLAHAGVVDGKRAGQYYAYAAVRLNGGTIYLPRARTRLHIDGATTRSLAIKHLRIDGRINPARFTINYDRAAGYFERDRVINISRLPAAPARTQHLGKTR